MVVAFRLWISRKASYWGRDEKDLGKQDMSDLCIICC
jgi:hypothetical protein